MTGLLRAELRKAFSTRLWWALGLPVLALAVLVNLFGGLFTAAVAEVASGPVPVLLGSLAYALALAAVFAAVLGIVGAAGEFRHRTITTTYLTASGRGAVLAAKMAVSALLGALYAAVTLVGGGLAGMLARVGDASPGPLLAVAAIGIVVCALWGAIGAALGVLVGNQVGALVGTLVYLLLGEFLASALLSRGRSTGPISAYLPGNAGDVALYDIPAREIVGPEAAGDAVALLAGVTSPPPWWVALLVLAGWTALFGTAAARLAGRRDVT